MKKILILTILSFGVRAVFGADECYVCLEKCEEPLQSHNCRHEGLTDDVKIKCFSIEIVSGGKTFTEKGCLPAEIADTECALANQNAGTKCCVCDGNLCNGRDGGGDGSGGAVNVLFLGLVGLCLVPQFVR